MPPTNASMSCSRSGVRYGLMKMSATSAPTGSDRPCTNVSGASARSGAGEKHLRERSRAVAAAHRHERHGERLLAAARRRVDGRCGRASATRQPRWQARRAAKEASKLCARSELRRTCHDEALRNVVQRNRERHERPKVGERRKRNLRNGAQEAKRCAHVSTPKQQARSVLRVCCAPRNPRVGCAASW